MKDLAPTGYDLHFEDMLCASSLSVPNVVVPIYGYKDWDVHFAGSFSPFAGWSGGSVSTNGSHPFTHPVAIVARGPANGMFGFLFSVP